MLVTVYVPKDIKGIASGSAVVGMAGSECNDGLIRIYYEGNIYGACNLHSMIDRLLVASYRLRDKAPTTAFMNVRAESLVKVGQFDLDSKTVNIDDSELFQSWVGSYGGDHG